LENSGLRGKLAAPGIVNKERAYMVPTGLLSIWVGAGPHFHSLFPIDKDSGIDGLVHWWLSVGANEYLGIRDIVNVALCHDLHYEPLRKIDAGLDEDLLLTPLQSIVSRCRRDVLDSKPTDQSVERHFWMWWLSDAQVAYGVTSRDAYLNQLCYLFRRASSLRDGDIGTLFVVAFAKAASAARSSGDAASAVLAFLEETHFSFLEKADEDVALSPFLSIIHQMRPDLSQRFDLGHRDERIGMWAWWHNFGQFEYVPSMSWVVARSFAALVRRAYDACRHDADELDRLAYLQLLRLKALPFDENTACILQNVIHSLERDRREKQPSCLAMQVALLVWTERSDLKDAFDLTDLTGWLALDHWWTERGRHEYFHAYLSKEEIGSISVDKGDRRKFSVPPVAYTRSLALIGYPRGEFGLGEDIRLLRSSLQSVNIEPTVIKAPWQISARQAINEQAEDAANVNFDSDVMVYVMPAFDTLTLLNKVGLSAFTARRKIGYWQWELDKFPVPAMIAFDLVDEIWCHSEHSARSFRSATDKPVIKVPLPVLVPPIRKVPRSTFQLNERNFVVFASFDGASSISRKNPMGVILAFQQAFPRKSHPAVTLVLKAMNTMDDALWRECQRKAALDERIKILDEVLDRQEYYELLRCCDAVISLHRAEGFGRVMAEAMALGIPVIATGYSGNLDFMNEDNSWLVPGQLSPLLPGDYPFHQAQEWMDPDIGEASRALQDCYENKSKRDRLVANAMKTIQRYTPAECGKVYAELLAQERW